MPNAATEALVREGFEYLNARKLEAFFALYDDKLTNVSLAGMGLPPTKDGFKLFVGGFYASFSDPRFVPQEVMTEAGAAMFRWVFKGTHTSPFNGVPATGRQVEVDAFTSFRLGPDGKIVAQHDVGDLAGLMRQLTGP